MLTKNERILVEAIKKSDRITIRISESVGSHYIEIKDKITKHDIAIALQSYFNRKH